jgi:hypothetical protein
MPVWRRLAISLAAGLAFAGPAHADETPQAEFASLLKCASGMGFYSALTGSVPAQATAEDRALLTRVTMVEDVLKGRTEALATQIGVAEADAISEASRAAARAQFEPFTRDPQGPRKVLDLYRPVLEACIDRAKALSPQ